MFKVNQSLIPVDQPGLLSLFEVSGNRLLHLQGHQQ